MIPRATARGPHAPVASLLRGGGVRLRNGLRGGAVLHGGAVLCDGCYVGLYHGRVRAVGHLGMLLGGLLRLCLLRSLLLLLFQLRLGFLSFFRRLLGGLLCRFGLCLLSLPRVLGLLRFLGLLRLLCRFRRGFGRRLRGRGGLFLAFLALCLALRLLCSLACLLFRRELSPEGPAQACDIKLVAVVVVVPRHDLVDGGGEADAAFLLPALQLGGVADVVHVFRHHRVVPAAATDHGLRDESARFLESLWRTRAVGAISQGALRVLPRLRPPLILHGGEALGHDLRPHAGL